MKADIRRLALDILCEHQAAGKYMNLALSTHRIDSLSTSERAQLTALVYTTTERRLTYDYYISALSKRESDKIDSYTKNILRLGLCQLLDMRSIPDFAAVNETVKLARNPGERSFVNGVLRAAERNKDSLPMPSEEKNYRRYLSVKYSFPLWIVKELDSLYGRTECEEMLRLFNEKKYTDLTVNTLKITPDKMLEALSESKIEGEISTDCGISVRLNSSKNPESLPGFGDGWFFVQDRASLVSAMALGAKAGELIIDACACPGGKSFAAAILTGDRADIRSFDLHPTKLSLIESGAERLGLGSIKVGELDALTPDESLFGLADRVICDVPCSGLGVLGKSLICAIRALRTPRHCPSSSTRYFAKAQNTLRLAEDLRIRPARFYPVKMPRLSDASLTVTTISSARILPWEIYAPRSECLLCCPRGTPPTASSSPP